MQGQGNLGGDVDESLAQQKAHGPGGVTEEPSQLLSQALPAVLLTEAEDPLLNLFSTRGALEKHREGLRFTTGRHLQGNLRVGAVRFYLTGKGSFLPRPSKPGYVSRVDLLRIFQKRLRGDVP